MSKLSPPLESKKRGSVCERCYLGECDGAACRPRITELLQRATKEESDPPAPTCDSVKSDDSMFQGINFSLGQPTGAKSEITVCVLEEDLFQCDMCKEKKKDLVFIPSEHRYCRQCICKWDVCEEFSPVHPDHTVQSHSPRPQYTGPGDVACDFCTGRKLRAVKSCLTCPASLCENHVRQHYTIPALQRHTLVEVSGDVEQRLCQQHHRALEVFCKTDQTHICKVCAVEEHQGHSKLYREIFGVTDTPGFLKLIVGKMKKNKLKTFKLQLNESYPDCLGSQLEDLDVCGVVEKMLESLGREEALKITFTFSDTEDISSQGKLTFLNEIYTELYITEGGSGEVNNEHEVRQIEMTSKRQTTRDIPIKLCDIFKTFPGKNKQIRTVLTKGIAGIGKTVSVQKFILDWAEGKANQDIAVIVPLPFRDLNLKKENYSLIQLLHQYAPELKEIKDIEDEIIKLLLIFDGLDECQFPLDFQNNELCYDVTKSTSLDVLLTNLIKGNLLPSALLWITSRPAAANQIPSECVHQVTEIRGFNDHQKEEYFRKKINDQSLANRIIKHIRSSRSLYIMCHIPVFCWLSATVLENMMSDESNSEIPKTLTEMYTHFLLIHISLKNKKYHGTTMENPKKLSESDKEMILKLGKLAFQQLEKGNLIFYEEDLRECGIDVNKASEYSSLCTEIFREELGLYREKVFCFVHLSIQEHLAAVYAHVSCLNEEKNVFDVEEIKNHRDKSILFELQQMAVTRALQSKNGHLDLFLRFLLGLSRDSNQTLLHDLMTETCSKMQTCSTREATEFIKMKIREESSPERIINLFHCLNELNDNSLVEEIQTVFRSGTRSDKVLEPDQCSALAYMLLMSEEVLDEFDLKSYKTSAAGRQRLLPTVRNCRRARLYHCGLSSESCVTVASALQLLNSPLAELNLGANDLKNSGVLLLCSGLMSQNCQLQTLGLKKCSLTDGCCVDLASVLKFPHSNLRELDLRDNDLQDSGVKLLCSGLEDPHCKLHTLKLAGCILSSESCESVASVLQSANSSLRELDLSYNNLKDSGVKLLSVELLSPNCKLQKLGVAGCNLSYESCVTVAFVLQSVNSPLRELHLSFNNLTDSGVKKLCVGLMSQNCKLQKLGLNACSLTHGCCLDLASVLTSSHCELRELELRDNDLRDSGVKLLSAGLEDPKCELNTLRLSGCLITEEGCASLASALTSNPSYLRELDLSYNHPGEMGRKLLFNLLEDPRCKLKKLELDHGGECRMKPGLRKYACQLTLEPNTAHRLLSLSDKNRTVTGTHVQQPYPDHPKRFKVYTQVLCQEILMEHCYFEVQWSGSRVFIGITHKNINKNEVCVGANSKALSLFCKKDGFTFWHNGKVTAEGCFPQVYDRIGVYLDQAAGNLIFYSIFNETQTLLHKVNTTFIEPMYVGFMVYRDTTVSLCQME
ncbi:NACHT, LRR and PYD domains-containing protein 12-like [Chanos chanos]|uniref:NACHT, LRR and PYD domains-containing protein 12-like n=1 Tax=Chanos chanos TaxID=29144 RepID=A0A6J2UR11_CHACN|nr:NACHT, LRR and PYD domains-containing protein 12-like [Chanos chanos]